MKDFKIYLQHDAMQCGTACLRMICSHYGADYSFDSLSKLCFATSEGVSLLGISEAAEKLGLHTVCGRVSLDNLAEAPLPCILHWNQNHFVVLYKVDVKKQKFYIADPGKGFAICRKKDMDKHWVSTRSDGEDKGVAMFIETTPAFYDNKRGNSHGESRSFRFLFGYIKKYKNISDRL